MKPQKIHWKRTFFALYFGQFFSLLSSSAVQFALIWHLTDTTNGSALVLTLAGLAGFLPQALIGPFAGAVADRYSRKTVMIAADGVVALAALALFAAMSLGEPSVMLILAVLAVRSLATAFHLPAMQASVPLMAPEEHLTKVAAWGQTIGSISLIAGPAVAMLLLANASIAWVLLLDAIGAAIAITIVLLIAIPNPDKPAEPVATGYWVEMKAGLSALVQHSVVFRLTIGVTVVSVLYIPLGTYFPLMTRNHFGLGVIEAGIVEIAFAAGLIAGGMAMGVLGDRFNKIKTMAFGVALLGGALSFSGLLDAAYFYGFAAAAVVAGFSGPVFSSPFYAYVQSHIEPHLLGRVFGLITSLALLATPLGYVIAGAVLGLGGVAVLFAAIGAAILLSAFWILAAENNKKGATHVENNQNI